MVDWRKYRDKDGNYLTKQQYQQLYGKGQEVPRTEDKVFDAVSNTGESLDLFRDDNLEVLANVIFGKVDGYSESVSKKYMYRMLDDYEMGFLKSLDQHTVNFIEKMKEQSWYEDYRETQKELYRQADDGEITHTDAKNIEQAWLMDKLMNGIKASGQKIEDFKFKPKRISTDPNAEGMEESQITSRYIQDVYDFVKDGNNVTINDLMKITQKDMQRHFKGGALDEEKNPDTLPLSRSLYEALVNKYDLSPELLKFGTYSDQAPVYKGVGDLTRTKGWAHDDPRWEAIDAELERQKGLQKKRHGMGENKDY